MGLPERVFVSPRVVAARLRVSLVGAFVVLHGVEGGALLDVHALVAAGRDLVVLDQVVVARVRAGADVADFLDAVRAPLRKNKAKAHDKCQERDKFTVVKKGVIMADCRSLSVDKLSVFATQGREWFTPFRQSTACMFRATWENIRHTSSVPEVRYDWMTPIHVRYHRRSFR